MPVSAIAPAHPVNAAFELVELGGVQAMSSTISIPPGRHSAGTPGSDGQPRRPRIGAGARTASATSVAATRRTSAL